MATTFTVRLVHPSIPVRTYDLTMREHGCSDTLEDVDAGDALWLLIHTAGIDVDTAIAMLMDADYGLTEAELQECEDERLIERGMGHLVGV